MKKIIILLVVLGALIGAAVIYQNQQNAVMNTAVTRGVKSRERLLPDFEVTAVKKLRIRDASSEATIIVNEDGKSARVAERGGYAASVDRINSALSELYEQRVANKQQVGKGAWAEIKVLPPGEGTEGVGTQIELIGEGDKIIKSLILGESISIAGGRSSTAFDGGTQRFVRIPDDGETIWVVSNSFFDLEPKPESWLDKSFIDVKDIKEITVTPAQAEEGWKAGRSEVTETEFKLLDAKAGEGLDNTKVTLGSLLSAPTFNDVVAKDKVAEVMKDAVKAKIVTFDGFTYNLSAAKQSKDGSDRYYLTVDVSADIPKARPAVKDEKEEDKKKADEAFASKKKSLEEKLAKEQKFAGWAFEVSEYTVNNFFKKRSEIVKVEAKAEPAPAPPTGAAASPTAPSFSMPTPGAAPASPPAAPLAPAPSAPSVSTPPIELPTAPKTEIKPEADPNAAPVVEQKK